MTIKPILLIGVILLSTVISCNKYPEGPAVSLRTKKERVANTWVIKQAIRNGNDVTSDYTAYTLTLSKDGDAKLVATYVFGNTTFQGNTNGTWSFENSKEHISFDYQNNDFDNKYQILRLFEDELWIREIGGEDELHLQPA